MPYLSWHSVAESEPSPSPRPASRRSSRRSSRADREPPRFTDVPKPAKGPHITYRPGLDGVRALAVIGVFLYHAKPHYTGDAWLPGGFLGVDLFFVLSGYLITSILLVEWEHHRRINVLRFWGRRARRLFPAVVVVVLASLLLAAIFARDHLMETRSDTFSSLFYFNNWHQIFSKS